MKKTIYLIGAFLLFICGTSIASEIRFNFSYHPKQAIEVTVKQGTSIDTLYTGVLDEKGKLRLVVPEAFRNYAGMATLKVAQMSSLDFIINGESFEIICPEEYVHGGNAEFKNSPENENLQKWFYEQSVRQHKIGLLGEVQQFYTDKEAFFSPLKKELQGLTKAQKDFESMLASSPLYAAKFIQLHGFLSKEVEGLVMADSAKMAEVREYVNNELDIESLFTSGIWFNVLNGLLALYDQDTPYHEDFISDMTSLMQKTKSDRLYIGFADNLISICEAMNWSNMEEQLAYFLINDGRISEPQGRLKQLMTMFKLSKGSKAPELVSLRKASRTLNATNTLLVFYESGCNSCENEILQLISNYPALKAKGYEVISIAADMDKNVFENNSRTYPWEQKYCDFQGLGGEDFINYGVIGTPTFYLIDKEGSILGRYARLRDTGIL